MSLGRWVLQHGHWCCMTTYVQRYLDHQAWNGVTCVKRLTTGDWELQELMNKKDLVGDLFNQLRLRRQRSPARQPDEFSKEDAELEDTLGQMLMVLDQLDSLIGIW